MPNGPRPAAATNVVALQADLLGLGFASTCSLGAPLSGSRNEIWQCPAYDQHGEPVVLYVKLSLSPRAMLVEALGAQIASALSLKSPPPFLVQVQSQHVGRPRGQRVIAFASSSAGQKGLAKPLRNLDELLRMLSTHRVAELAAVYDEWIGNDVRSPSDILICPEQGPIFIDHEAAMPDGLDPGATLTNWLADRLMQGMNADERRAFHERLRKRSAAVHRLRLDTVPGVLAVVQGGAALYADLVRFLQLRLGHLDRLLSQRALPEQQYLIPAPDPQPNLTPNVTPNAATTP